MPAPRRLPILLACVAGACALSAPSAGAAPANAGQGVVLSAGGGVVRLVATAHRVTDVRVRSARNLRRGDVVTVRDGRARVRGHVRRVAFLGRVLRRSGRGAVVRLGDGSTFTFSGAARAGRSARAALAPGQNLLITLATGASGNVAVKAKLLPAVTDVGDGKLRARGVVTDDEGDGSFAIRADDGSGLRFGDPQHLLEAADAVWCDVVEVAFHKQGRRLVADDLRVVGASDEGDCAEDGEWSDEADGIVTALAADGSSLTIAPADGGADATYPVADPALLDGIAVGDEVAVWLDEDGTAIDVELLGWSEEPDPGDGEDPGFDDGGGGDE